MVVTTSDWGVWKRNTSDNGVGYLRAQDDNSTSKGVRNRGSHLVALPLGGSKDNLKRKKRP